MIQLILKVNGDDLREHCDKPMDRHDKKGTEFILSSNTANMYKCIYKIVYTHTQTLILLYILSIPWKIMSFINQKTTFFLSQHVEHCRAAELKEDPKAESLVRSMLALNRSGRGQNMPSCCSWVLKKLFYYMKIIMNLHCEYWKVCFFCGIQIWPVCGVAHHAYQYSATYHSRLLPMLGQEVT